MGGEADGGNIFAEVLAERRPTPGAQVSVQAPLDLSLIYERYHGKVVAYAAKLIGRDDAEDVAHEVFIKVRRALPTLVDPSRLASWVFAIAANTVRDFARARAARWSRFSGSPRVDDDGADPLASLPDTAARTAEEIAARNEMVACYLGYVEQLPVNYYDVYVLSEIEGLSDAEIAQKLSISVGAAKIRLHRARARLFGELRSHCTCYRNERGELMGEPASAGSAAGRHR